MTFDRIIDRMHNTLRALAGAAGALLAFSAAAGPITITFDTLADGITPLPNNSAVDVQYLADDVTISGSATVTPIATSDDCAGGCGSLVQGQILENWNSKGARAQTITISFTNPVRDISFVFVPFGQPGDKVSVQAFAADDLVFQAAAGTQRVNASDLSYLFSVDADDVTSLQLSRPGNWVFGLDNLTFTVDDPPILAAAVALDPAAVPEPASLALAGLAFAALGLSRRRTR
ncbi:MAG TPA: PEP-CTERM sorting domain-containing protein [Burkholderiales bacterium]|nr:PEP-CTERM sorting domain-containing protein [Burkholderiales bacterium]